VTNPLVGPDGAARVYGPQKGATAEGVEVLDAGLERLAVRTRNLEKASLPGAGAAGGLGFGLVAFFGATLRSGVDLVIDAVRLRERLRGASLCITGEGRLDAQSLAGKTPVGVARACREAGVACVALAGAVELGEADVRAAGFAGAFPIADDSVTIAERVERAVEMLSATAARAVQNSLR
jgi:glycerate kinase